MPGGRAHEFGGGLLLLQAGGEECALLERRVVLLLRRRDVVDRGSTVFEQCGQHLGAASRRADHQCERRGVSVDTAAQTAGVLYLNLPGHEGVVRAGGRRRGVCVAARHLQPARVGGSACWHLDWPRTRHPDRRTHLQPSEAVSAAHRAARFGCRLRASGAAESQTLSKTRGVARSECGEGLQLLVGGTFRTQVSRLACSGTSQSNGVMEVGKARPCECRGWE